MSYVLKATVGQKSAAISVPSNAQFELLGSRCPHELRIVFGDHGDMDPPFWSVEANDFVDALLVIRKVVSSDEGSGEKQGGSNLVQANLDDGRKIGPAKGLTGVAINGCPLIIQCMDDGSVLLTAVRSATNLEKKTLRGVRMLSVDGGRVNFKTDCSFEHLDPAAIELLINLTRDSQDEQVSLSYAEL